MLRKVLKYIACSLLGVGIVAALTFGSIIGGAERDGVECCHIVVEIEQNAGAELIDAKDVRKILEKSYGTIIGTGLYALELSRLEKSLSGQECIARAEVYTTLDSTLRVSVTPKIPYLRFSSPGGGFYCTKGGEIFPLQEGKSVEVPVIEGNIPVNVPKGYCGKAQSEWEQNWIENVIEIQKNIQKKWSDKIKAVRIEDKGDVVLVPCEGSERFIFGSPKEIERKFDQLGTYYSSVKDSINYKSVNLKYKDQIVCRR